MLLRAFRCCPIDRPEWSRMINSTSRGKAKAQYLRELREYWPDYEFTDIAATCEGPPRTSDRLRRCAMYRGMPSVRAGTEVRLSDGRTGRVVDGNDSANFDVLVDGVVLNCHPATLELVGAEV